MFRNSVPGGCGGGSVLFVSYEFTVDRKNQKNALVYALHILTYVKFSLS